MSMYHLRLTAPILKVASQQSVVLGNVLLGGGIQNSPEPCLYIHIGGYTASCAAMSYPDIGAVVSILTSHCVCVFVSVSVFE